MNISDIRNKDEFSAIIISELKTFGVKYQKEKKKKDIQNKTQRKNIFRTHLHLLDLTDVILANGRVVQIPSFVAEACNRILEQVETEGIFRKAGSFVRQKQIRVSLESGVDLGKSHHVIDVANVIKYFFRELPEPVIPKSIQETLLRSLLVGDNYVKAILLACLLLPPLTINTLSFFMQFLYTVSLSEHLNKMSVENLAIIFTPSLMPFPNINSHRFKNHVKIVQILIENANAIGTIPKNIENKLQESTVSEKTSSDQSVPDAVENLRSETGLKSTSAKKKKKRRSEMFNGLRRIVGSAMGSSEYLDCTPNENSHIPKVNKNIHKENEDYNTTPCCKDNKKRKLGDPVSTFSSKKKESKKSRLSLGGGRHIKTISLNPVVTSMERRWSIVGSGWSKTKNRRGPEKKCYMSNNCLFDVETAENEKKGQNRHQQSRGTDDDTENKGDESDCIKMSKIEYEEIKERVAAIESHISNEFGAIHTSTLNNSSISVQVGGLDNVQTQYERMVVQTEALSSPATEQLAQRLSRGLNIRQTIDQRVIRSPSARKIGTIRRRSQDKVRVLRNPSWHMHSSKCLPPCNESDSLLHDKNPTSLINTKLFYANHKIAGQHFNSYSELSSLPPPRKHNLTNSLDNILTNDNTNEKWMSGEEFFSNMQFTDQNDKINDECLNQIHVEHVTPVSRKNYYDAEKTPMLPPKSLPRKMCNLKTPLKTTIKPSTTSKLPFVNRIATSTPAIEEVSGRASIARLRAQNAGMVMAKAKLFDGLGNSGGNEPRSMVEMEQKTNTIRHTMALENSICFKSTVSLDHSDIGGEVQSKKTLTSTPIAKRIQSANLNTPTSSLKRRQRCNASKYPQKQFIRSIVADDNLTKRRNLNERTFISENRENRTPNNSRNRKSPRRVKKHRQQIKHRSTHSGV
ncbi:rho GTPase-activating protein gacN-like isoform X3 [Lucilia sericata]|uniref:rho GTPase-activating protein gacN-like isoform X3 n=1 Tax=Lucilia sericata TaxID=13632 RepID=UPI0018A81EF1|nr:rho GTPase-activating protein gacN-like isoform X3 [Lucilia sericata]